MAKKNDQVVFTETTPIFVIREYVYKTIHVLVSINFNKGEVSLLEGENVEPQSPFQAKRWVFKNRGLEYMQGWRDILDAIKYAIDMAEGEVKEFNKMIDERNTF